MQKIVAVLSAVRSQSCSRYEQDVTTMVLTPEGRVMARRFKIERRTGRLLIWAWRDCTGPKDTNPQEFKEKVTRGWPRSGKRRHGVRRVPFVLV